MVELAKAYLDALPQLLSYIPYFAAVDLLLLTVGVWWWTRRKNRR